MGNNRPKRVGGTPCVGTDLAIRKVLIVDDAARIS